MGRRPRAGIEPEHVAHDVLAINPGQREGRFILQVSFGFRVVDEPEVVVPSGNDPHPTRRYEVASPVSNGGTRWANRNDGRRILLGVRASVYGIPGSRSKQRLLEGLDQRRNPRVHKRVRLRVDISPGGMRGRLRHGCNAREDDPGQLDADHRGVHTWHVSRRLLSLGGVCETVHLHCSLLSAGRSLANAEVRLLSKTGADAAGHRSPS